MSELFIERHLFAFITWGLVVLLIIALAVGYTLTTLSARKWRR